MRLGRGAASSSRCRYSAAPWNVESPGSSARAGGSPEPDRGESTWGPLQLLLGRSVTRCPPLSQVSEVLSEEKSRLSVSGWFHGPSLARPARRPEPALPRSPHVPCDVSIQPPPAAPLCSCPRNTCQGALALGVL